MKISRRTFLGAAAAGAAVGLGGYGWRSQRLDVVEIAAPLPGLGAPLRVLFASDIHAPHHFLGRGVPALAAAAEAFEPHIFAFGGDAFEHPSNVELALETLAPVRVAPGGVKLAVLGNHEYWSGCDLAALRRDYERACGVRLLVNEVAEVAHAGGRVRVIGLDDDEGNPMPGLAAGPGPAIVLAHRPGAFDAVARVPGVPPLVCLSGHTHGGQVTPFGIVLFTPGGSSGYVHGWYERGPHRLYVSRGLGNAIVRFRVGARPEIVLLTLVPKETPS